MAGRKASDQNAAKGATALEWIAAAVGAAIAIAMFGLIAVDAFSATPTLPPLMQVRPVALHAAEGQYVLEVDVVNRSSQTGAAVQIEGDLKQGGASVETSHATLTYVPGKSDVRAGLVFARDPRRHRLELRVTGYEQP